MRTIWECGNCRHGIEHRWEGNHLVFACTNKREPHYIERRIVASLVRGDVLIWLIPLGEILGLIAFLF